MRIESCRWRPTSGATVAIRAMAARTEVPAHPLTGECYALGGTDAANTAARADSWSRVLHFRGARVEQAAW